MSKIWNSFDRFRQLVSSVQSSGDIEVSVPLEGPIAEAQQQHVAFFKALRGSGQFAMSMEEADTYEIVEVTEELDARIPGFFPESNGTLIKLKLSSPGKIDKIFTFGEYAVFGKHGLFG